MNSALWKYAGFLIVGMVVYLGDRALFGATAEAAQLSKIWAGIGYAIIVLDRG